MSGIAVVYQEDGRPVSSETVDRMLHAIRHRGPDGIHRWLDGNVGLGQALLHTTPESLRERYPMSADGCWMVWDGRVDNREELLAALDAAGIACGGQTDAELALGAYRRWDERCAGRLLGDFAFVIWDSRTRTLFGARDRLGLKPFYYTRQDGTLLIASEAKALLAVLDKMPEPDDEILLAVLMAECREADNSRSLFAGIHRLPPGHTMYVRNGAMRIARYWQLDPAKQTIHKDPQAYVEQFRGLFEDAVKCRTRSAFPVGCILSGGLDSSSITMLAARQGQRVEAFTVFAQRPATDERAFSKAVCEVAGIPLWEFSGLRADPLDGLDELLRQVECPLIAPHRFSSAFGELIQSRGCRVLLHGDGGDHLMDELGYLADLLLHTDPARFLRETRAFAQWYGAPMKEFVEDAVKGAVPVWFKSRLKRLLVPGLPAWVRRDLAKSVHVAGHLALPRSSLPFQSRSQALIYEEVFSPYFLVRLEQSERELAHAGREMWYPFLHSRLIEFVASVPWHQRCRTGQRKWLLREAMRGLLPEPVRMRKGKGDWTAETDDAVAGLCRRNPPEPLANRSGMMDRYVEWPRADSVLRQYLNGNRSVRWDVWSLVALDHWLAQFWTTGGRSHVGETAYTEEAVRAPEAACLR